jgi:type VI secretion system protein VasD
MKIVIKILILIFFIFLLIGCSPEPINVAINPAYQLNADQQSESLPVEVRLYQLRDKDAFLQATFRELWQQDTATLGNSLLDKRTLMVSPGVRTERSLTRNKDCQYLGVMAVFRRPWSSDWRVLAEVKDHTTLLPLTIKIKIHHDKVILDQ